MVLLKDTHSVSQMCVALIWKIARLLASYKPGKAHGRKSPDRQWPAWSKEERGCEMLQARKRPHFLERVDSMMINKAKAARCEMRTTTEKPRNITRSVSEMPESMGFLVSTH